MKRAPRSRQRHDLYAKYHDYDSEISDLLGECGVKGIVNVDGLGNTSSLNFTGDESGNFIRGGNADDVLDGKGGADAIYGGAGSDTIFYDAADVLANGGAGVDILFLRGSQPSTINLAAANQVVGSTNVVTGFEYVHGVEMTNAITVTGDANNNVFNMGSGNDIIDGGAGFDTLYGNGGDDRIVYDGADALSDGGAGSDTLVVSRATALTIDLRNADQVAGDTGGTTGFENVDGSGSTGSLTIISSVGDSTLRGGSGNDIIPTLAATTLSMAAPELTICSVTETMIRSSTGPKIIGSTAVPELIRWL